MLINVKDHIVELIKDELEDSKSKWKPNSLFYSIKTISIDQRGRIGEHFIKDIFQQLKFVVEYNNNSKGDYDIKIGDYKVEVKTATLDVNNKFQHEGIKESQDWDLIAFIDIAPEEIYLSFIPRINFRFGIDAGKKYNKKLKKETKYIHGMLEWKNINQKIHFRGKDNTENKATGQGYKVDLKINEIQKIEKIEDIKNMFTECTDLIKKYQKI